MKTKNSQFQEERLYSFQNIKLLKRFYPFVRPHRVLLVVTILLVIVITAIDLAIPYVTKIAVDRYIVPVTESVITSSENDARDSMRFFSVDLKRDGMSGLVTKYKNLFRIEGETGYIRFDNISKMDPGDIIRLRSEDLNGIGIMTLLLCAFIFAHFIFSFFQVMLMEYMGQQIMHNLRMSLFTRIQKLSLSFFSRNPVGRLVTRVTNDIQNMYEMVTSMLTFTFKDLFLLVGIIILLVVLNWQLALACFVVLPFIIYISQYFGNKSRVIYRVLRVKIAEINTRISETISGIKIIQLYNQEKSNSETFEKLNHENFTTSLKQVNLFALFTPIMNILSALTLSIIIFYGGLRIVSQDITLGTLVVFISYLKLFFRPIRDITEKYNILQNALASAERIFILYDTEDEMLCQEPFCLSPDRIESIAFESVSFSYVEDEPVLKNVNFEIKRGQSLAIVGPSGAGKTSLINLILRFYKPVSGLVRINNLSNEKYQESFLREKIAIVTQEPFLFSGTIKENILSGRKTVSSERLDEVLELSRCNEFIKKLPSGIDEMLGEGAVNLSSGERQLISIARAFAGDPEVIILDEATSYIDSESEVYIQEALSNLMAHRTSLIIAHRLSTARGADTIIVLDDGVITEKGSHQELMNEKGTYYHMSLLQT